jgi:nucleoside-diphosphate-sugar epimerase
MKILLTGASGFIGRHVLRELAATEHGIIATALEPRPDDLDLPSGKDVRWVSCDLNETRDDFFDFFGGPDCLIHLSWHGLPNYRELFHIEKNLPANRAFIRSCVQGGLKDVTIAGTCLEYGVRNGPLSEDMAADPSISYAIAKDSLRRYVEELRKSLDFSFKWIRLFYMHGAGQSRSSLLSQLHQALQRGDTSFDMSRGDQLRDYLPVEMVAKYIVRIALQKSVQGVINCCSGKPISIRELVERYLQERGAHIRLNLGAHPYPDYEAMAFWGDTQKLRRAVEIT